MKQELSSKNQEAEIKRKGMKEIREANFLKLQADLFRSFACWLRTSSSLFTRRKLSTVRGFTMLEIALSIAILGIIFGMTIPMFRVFTIRNDMDIAVTTLVQDYRRAQTLSQIADGDSSWSVHTATGSILIYKGVSYALRDQTFDEITQIPTSLIIGGLTNVTFTKHDGMPQSTGTTTFTSTANETRNVTINQKGMVDY